MSEPEKVLCPYCGYEMEFIEGFEAAWFDCPNCKSSGPAVFLEKKIETLERYDKTLAATLKRYMPPQGPLTLEEVKALEFPFPLWVEYKGKRQDEGVILWPEIVFGIRRDGTVDLRYDWLSLVFYQSMFRFWRYRPTGAERKAAPWEESNG